MTTIFRLSGTRQTRVCVNPISQSAVRAETVTQTASGHPMCASEKVKAAVLAMLFAD